MAILEWKQWHKDEWHVEARYEGTERVSPRWTIFLGSDGRWHVSIDGHDLTAYTNESEEGIKLTAQSLEDLRVTSHLSPPIAITSLTLARLHEWNLATFGPGARTAGTLEHIRRELSEIQDKPNDLTEWADVVILAFNGALRMGFSPDETLTTILDKLAENETRSWPDWRTVPEGVPIEHLK